MKDALEAYQTYRSARSLFFWILLIGLFVLQTMFWIVDLGKIDAVLNFDQNQSESVFVKVSPVYSTKPVVLFTQNAPESPEPAPEKDAPAVPDEKQMSQNLDTLVQVSLRFFNTVNCFMAVLYCLTLLIGMKLALVGRLGGLAESVKAFFLSLVVLVLVVPWQSVIAGQTPGTLFSYQELTHRYIESTTYVVPLSLDVIAYYVRFVGFWFLTIILLLVAQWRSNRAARQVAQRYRPTQPAQVQPMISMPKNPSSPGQNDNGAIPLE